MVILDILSSLFPAVWSLFTDVEVPGLGVSFGTFLIAMIVIRISIMVLQHAFDFGGSGTGYRSGSTRNPKISNERKGDTH